MKNSFCQFLVFALLIYGSNINAQSDIDLEAIKKTVLEFPDSTEFSIAIIQDEKATYKGFRKIGDSIEAIHNEQTVFEIGSITKVFTSTLLTQMVIEDIIELDDYIDKSLGFKPKSKKTFTFQSLANHTSGLPRLPTNLNYLMNLNDPYQSYDEDTFNAYIKDEMVPLEGKEGQYQYSNLGAGLLAKLLCQIEGSNFNELLNKRIFGPLEMSRSTCLRKEVKGKLVEGRNTKGQITPYWSFNALAGAGAILSTTEDLSKFVMDQFDQNNEANLLSQTSTYNIDNHLNIGLGWHIFEKEGRQLHWHNGSTGGFSSYLIFEKEKQNAIVILANICGMHPKRGKIDQLAIELLTELNK